MTHQENRNIWISFENCSNESVGIFHDQLIVIQIPSFTLRFPMTSLVIPHKGVSITGEVLGKISENPHMISDAVEKYHNTLGILSRVPISCQFDLSFVLS